MPFTTLAGLRIKAPTRGTRNWDAVVLTDTWTPISQHQHTGDPDGLQIPTGGIADNAITGAKIRLSNEEYLRSRNAADDGDINIVRVNSSDVVELGVTSMDVQVAGQLLLPTEVTTTAGAIRYNSTTKKYLGNDGTSEISIGGEGGDASWTMIDSGSGQITFNSGSRTVNEIVKDLSSDVTTNATVVAITDDTLTVVDASNGFLYEASDTIRIFTFYDIVDGEFSAIGNSASDTKWDYRNGDASFNIVLSRYVPVGYVDVTASGSPGTVSVVITNFPVQSWTTVAVDGHPGILTYYNVTTVNLSGSGDFTSGTLKVERINDTVTITSLTTPTFPSDSEPASAINLIPTWARPSSTKTNVTVFSGARIWMLRVNTNGSIAYEVRTWAGALSNTTTDAGNVTAISYSVETP